MKSNKFLVVPVLAACLALLAGCIEDDPVSPDYRDAWVGTYVGYTDVHTSSGDDHQSDTTYTDQSLSVSKYGGDSLTLEYLNTSYRFSCSADGVFEHTDNPHGGYYGNFSGDSLHFHIYDITSGHSVSQFFKGKKQ